MPYIPGKGYVLPDNNDLEPLSKETRASNILRSTGRESNNLFESISRPFNGYIDDYIGYIDDPSRNPYNTNFNQLRAENQGTGEKLLNSTGKFLWNATSTALDGTVGMVIGIGNKIAGGEGGYTENPFSKALDEISDKINENLQSYQTKHYKDASILENAFSAEGIGNFWGDTIFANAGYAVGAMATGLTLTPLVKGGVRAAAKLIGRFGKNALSITESMARFSTTEEILANLSKPLTALKRMGVVESFATAALGATSEARMEAVEAVDNTVEMLKQQGVWDKLSPEEQEQKKSDIAYSVGWANMGIVTLGNLFAFKAFLPLQ
jgi:hypothetical protein